MKKWENLADKRRINLSFDEALRIKDTIFDKYAKPVKEDIILCRREQERFMGSNKKTTYEDKGLTSSSISEYTKVDKYGNELNYILIPKGTKILYLEKVTQTKGDFEVLLPTNMQFSKVQDISSNKMLWELSQN